MNDQEDEFAGIPDMPSDNELQSEILRTSGPAHWNPFGSGQREPVDFSKLPNETAQAVLKARVLAGPGPSGNAYQWEVHRQLNRASELERERRQILDQLEQARSYDPVTGDPIPMFSPERRKAMGYRLADIVDEIDRLDGEPGKRRREQALAKATHAEKSRIKQNYNMQEAKRRAAVEANEAEIARLQDGFRKVRTGQ